MYITSLNLQLVPLDTRDKPLNDPRLLCGFAGLREANQRTKPCHFVGGYRGAHV